MYIYVMQKMLLLCLLSFFSNVYANDSLYARRIVDTLSSGYFSGRGYVNDGMQKAAGFIARSFAELQTVPVKGKSYLQSFKYSVNRFPGAVSLTVNGKTLQPGKDFLVLNESRSFKGNGNLEKADSVTWINHEKRVTIKLTDKLTWSVKTEQADYTGFTILKSAVNNPASFAAEVEADFMPSFKADNVVAMVKGTAVPDSFLVFTAHYDHLGMMGKNAVFPGANDNAGGVAMLLTLAKYYAANPSRYSVVFMAFAGEEAGLIGSAYYVKHPTIPLHKIRFLTNLDLMGNGEEGITVVNATEFQPEFELLKKLNAAGNYLTTVNSRGKAANSDHYWFAEQGVHAFFIYTLGKRKSYHDIDDVASTLSLSEINDLDQLLIQFYDSLSK